MKIYSYNLSPKLFVLFGYVFIILAFAILLTGLNSAKNENILTDFATSIAIIIIGLIMISFKSKLIIDDKSGFVIKESGLWGMTFSKEKIRIPKNCDRILIKQKTKKGSGYYRFVIPVAYSFKSFDMFFHSETGMARLINTDYKRAIKIGEFFKSKIGLDYTLELSL
jgi:hypothetical protein